MLKFKIGQMVKSIYTEDKMKIVKIKGLLLICIIPDEPKIYGRKGYYQFRYLLSKQNAIAI